MWSFLVARAWKNSALKRDIFFRQSKNYIKKKGIQRQGHSPDPGITYKGIHPNNTVRINSNLS